MESILSGIVGVVLLCSAVAMLWISRINSSAKAHHHELHDEIPAAAPARPKRTAIDMMPLHAPNAVTSAALCAEDAMPAALELEADQLAVGEVPPADMPDCEEAQLHLNIATKLQVIGDFSGVQEYTGFVLELKTASQRQRSIAESLLNNSRGG